MLMSKFVQGIRKARQRRDLPKHFRAKDVRKACPGWAYKTYSSFLPKHRRGNPGGYTAYFERHSDDSYSLIEE
jgi:hypothetical protein